MKDLNPKHYKKTQTWREGNMWEVSNDQYTFCSWKLRIYAWRCPSCSQPWIDTWIHNTCICNKPIWHFFATVVIEHILVNSWQVFRKCTAGHCWWMDIRFYCYWIQGLLWLISHVGDCHNLNDTTTNFESCNLPFVAMLCVICIICVWIATIVLEYRVCGNNNNSIEI